MNSLVSVIIPSYNPNPEILNRVLDSLYRQSLPIGRWELIIVNNASTNWPDKSLFINTESQNLTIVKEPRPGATHARRRGLESARGDIAVLVDDDNILSSNYLEKAIELLKVYPKVGAIGGKVELAFSQEPPLWIDEFRGILGGWNHGNEFLVSNGICPTGSSRNQYPYFAPLTAGLVLRRPSWEAWLKYLHLYPIMSDRCKEQLTSGGDNDAILAIMKAGWEVAYSPQLCLKNYIPSFRLSPSYLAKLNYECRLGFIRALRRHDACPWPLIPKWTLPLRVAKSWIYTRAWQSSANHIRWRGQVGHFRGLVRSDKSTP